MAGCLIEKTAETIKYADFRSVYIVEKFPKIKTLCRSYNIKCSLDAEDRQISIVTSLRCEDPYNYFLCRDFVKLVCRGVPIELAEKVFGNDVSAYDDFLDKTAALKKQAAETGTSEDKALADLEIPKWSKDQHISYDIIDIDRLVRNRDMIIKRRNRLIGPNGSTIKALEILTGCTIVPVGATVSCIGPVSRLPAVRKTIEEAFTKVHPVLLVKKLMVQRELSKKEDMKNVDWTSYMPVFKKKNQKRFKSTVKEEA